VKIFINFSFNENINAGGHNFLKYLKGRLLGEYELVDDIRVADIVIVNSHHQLLNPVRQKFNSPSIKIIHRIDGPICCYRSDGFLIDLEVLLFSVMVADFLVFQSRYSLKYFGTYSSYFGKNTHILSNSADPLIFFPKPRKDAVEIQKILKIGVTSFSSNPLKGLEDLVFLDKNLDFDKFDIWVVGGLNYPFENIKFFEKRNAAQLGEFLRELDAYLFCSKYESCSNALVEAVQTGLPVIYLDSSSNSEFAPDPRLGYKTGPELLARFDLLLNNFDVFASYALENSCAEYRVNEWIDFLGSVNNIDKNLSVLSIAKVRIILPFVVVALYLIGLLRRVFPRINRFVSFK
jgi:hypothetical protein